MEEIPNLVETRNEVVKDRKRAFLLNRSESNFGQESGWALVGDGRKALSYEAFRQAIRAGRAP